MEVQCKTLRENCHGFTSWLSPQCGGYSRELQTKSPGFSLGLGWGGGGWLQMTSTIILSCMWYQRWSEQFLTFFFLFCLQFVHLVIMHTI